ncbi:hypothetical protein AGLY_017452 [Aphis glycines]|uniref:Endonuclease/exonuclease/phosphatase domain-containing protein n=1 Tax=Aphis glycines TaxID=307491 RepID=A0A6G0SVA1_APHGL|nr:hypothetical protein AGLY_017452 [Aphis glycines]
MKNQVNNTSLKQTITKTLGHKNNTAKRNWITAEVVNLIEERRKYKNLNRTEGQKRYRSLRNLIIRKSKEAKEKYLEVNCRDIESLMKTGRREEAYKMVKKFFGQYKPRAGGIEDNNGKMLWEQKDIAKRWKEYLEILCSDRCACRLININSAETPGYTYIGQRSPEIRVFHK